MNQFSGEKLTFARFSPERARSISAVVEEIYRDAYAEAIATGDPFDSVESFMHRFEVYTARSTFDLVIAYQGDRAIGQTWGWPLSSTATTGWWAGLLHEPEPDFTVEDGARTFALSEIMVRSAYVGHGIAHALHDELLKDRPEQRATLLVEPDNIAARRAYLHWGWQHVAQLRPGWDHAPLFDVLVRPLPLRPAAGLTSAV
jgi:GNAT superfamily N-acetyltransferase